MATKQKTARAKPPSKKTGLKKKGSSGDKGTEPLSNFQKPKTGRVDNTPAATHRSAITIEKVKIKKDDAMMVNFSKFQNWLSSHYCDTFEQRMHPDLKGKFRDLRIHLALLCDYISTQQVKDLNGYNPELVEKFNVSALSIKEDGVVITGHKITKSGKAVILNTPFTLFESEGENSYRYAEQLQELVEEFTGEVLQYLDGSKVGEDPQGKIEFPELEEDFAEVGR